ncbi:Soluble lytic murein transglycosylase precursor [Minicystis rosea]|nr:Soluble lytic murein transglycosylase precursor [Minicystis rosea]
MRHSIAFCLFLLAAGCAERRFAGPPPPSSTAASPPSLAATVPESTSATIEATAPGPPASWVEAVRLERWPEAAALIDALPEATRARADMRYVRARAALGVADGARAVALLDKLEAELPVLAVDIERWRAEAQLLAGPYAPAAAYFARSTKARDLLRAAAAYQKAGDAPAAKSTADRAVAAAARAKSARDEASARLTRAQIAEAQGAPAIAEADYRWVAARAASTADGRAATQALERLKKPLSPKEKAALADGSTDDPGASDDAPAAPSAAPKAPPPKAPPPKPQARGETLHARGMAQWKARAYADAAKTLRDAAAARSGHEAEDLHYAARALSRIDHDEEAVKVYRQVVQRWPRSAFAERSAYYAARLDLTNGRFREAATGYAMYLTTFRKGDHRDEAEYERALALLSSGGAGAARKTFAAMAHKASPDRAGRLRELEGVAALRAGDRAGAVALWTDVSRNQPLTWAALAARARLAEVKAPVPPILDPPAQERALAPLDLRMPSAPALLASVGLDGDAETYLLAAEREVSAGYAGRENEALCNLYGLLSRGKRRYRLAQNAVDGAWLMRAPSAGERWAWECVYPEPFVAGVRALEAQHAMPRGLIHAIMRQESAFDPIIVSPASAVGLMQLMPSTAKQAASEIPLPFEEGDLVRPDVNLKLGAFYLAKLLKMFQGNVVLAAAAYNAGPRAVSHWVEPEIENDLDLWVARIPFDETRNYVARVAQNLARYQWLAGGDAAVTPVVLAVPTGLRAPPDAY